MIYRVDLDGIIWDSIFLKEQDTYLINEFYDRRIEQINEYFDRGDTIILETGRHWNKFHETLDQLTESGIKYHTLVMGKPPADVYIDDKAVQPEKFFKEEN